MIKEEETGKFNSNNKKRGIVNNEEFTNTSFYIDKIKGKLIIILSI